MKKQNAVAKPEDLNVLEETGTAFNPMNQHIDLTKDEKRRTTALMMAIQAYDNLIIKDAEMYIAINRENNGRDNAPRIKPATIDAIVEAACKFDLFISSETSKAISSDTKER